MSDSSKLKPISGLIRTELELLCSSNRISKGLFPVVYWTSELYSFGRYIRMYGYYPSFLPLAVYSDHSGPALDSEIYKHELEANAPVFLTHSELRAKKYKALTSKKSFTMFSPAVFYRRKFRIEQSPFAQGTIAFPVHTVPGYNESFNVESYISDLKALPQKYHPVAVCLHMHDINKLRHLEFLNFGIPVFTAGNTSDFRFIERFYDIIKMFKYTTSNRVGTVTFYSIEMGIPFFLLGVDQTSINIEDENFPKGEFEGVEYFNTQVLNRKLLDINKLDINDSEIQSIISYELGLRNGISRLKMSIVLWHSLFQWMLSFAFLEYIVKNLRKVLLNK